MTAASSPTGRQLSRAALLLCSAALIATACGSDGDDETATEPDTEADEAAAESGEEPDSEAEESADAPEPNTDEITLAFSNAVPQVEKVPTNIALDSLEQDGFNTDILYLESSEDPINAVVRGDANIGSASASAVFAAIGQGIPITAVMQANGPNYAIAAPSGATDPSDLDGLRFGIHAEVSSTALYLAVATEDYPDVEPQVLVVPGSANRIEAMVADELDSSVIQLAEIPRLEELAPGEFEIIWNFAEQNPDFVDSVIFVHNDVLQDDPGLVETFIEAELDAVDYTYENVDEFAGSLNELVPDTDEQLAQDYAEIHTDSELWPRNGGLTAEGVELTIDALATNELIEDVPDPADTMDRSALESVLERTGR